MIPIASGLYREQVIKIVNRNKHVNGKIGLNEIRTFQWAVLEKGPVGIFN
ncbi:hypothetical protein JYT50_00895 [bacterium AH-315-A23]|nr:hypothetical protein [bacterium AH-315-A23]